MDTEALRRLYPTLPIWVKDRIWAMNPMPLHRCTKFLAFWAHKGKRRPVSWWAEQSHRIKFNKSESSLQRTCESLASHRLQTSRLETLAVFVAQDGRDWYIIDGNHRLIGCLSTGTSRIADVAVWYGVDLP